ncbi:MAG: hypothetical protein ACM33C_01565, partial [Syntrophaceae bacterium]
MTIRAGSVLSIHQVSTTLLMIKDKPSRQFERKVKGFCLAGIVKGDILPVHLAAEMTAGQIIPALERIA